MGKLSNFFSSKDKKKLDRFVEDKFQHMAKDKEDNFVFLAESSWALQMAQEKNPDIEFYSNIHS